MGKTEVLISGPGVDVLQKYGKDLCAVCLQGVSSDSIFCDGCSIWVQKRCSCISGTLKPSATFRCKRCTGLARPIDGKPITEVTLGSEKLEAMLYPAYHQGRLWTRFHNKKPCHMAWVKFNEFLPILTSRSFPITFRERVYNSCTRNAHGIETSSDLHHLQCIDRALVHCMRGVADTARRSGEGTTNPLTQMTCPCRKWWLADESPPWGGRGSSRPKKTWPEIIRMACLALCLTETHHSDRKAWNDTLRSVVRLDPSQHTGLITPVSFKFELRRDDEILWSTDYPWKTWMHV